MATILVDELSASNLYLGVCGENNIEVITIDCSAWLTTYPNATFTVFAQLPRRSDVYPVSGVQVEDGVITWNVSSYDTSAAGNGMVEVRMYDDEKLKKSFMARTRIMPSLSGEETVPNEEAATWLGAIVANEKDRQSNEEVRQQQEQAREENSSAIFAKIAGMEVSVETLEPGSDATVTKTETETEYSLSFAIPRGDKGDKGDKGDPGEVTQAELDAVTSQLADYKNKFVTTEDQESASLGPELLDATGWTSDGWAGDFATGFTHISGNTNALTRALPSTGTKIYLVEFDTSAALPTQTLTVSIGGSATFDLYRGTSLTHYSIAMQSVSDGTLVITPVTGYEGTITNLSVREVTAPYASPFNLLDSAEENVFAIRGTSIDLENLYLGAHAGENNVTGDCNVGVGSNALQKNVAGFWNSAIGGAALRSNISGTRNVAIGYNALTSNVNGHRNIAIGTFSNPLNTTGDANVSIGADSMLSNVSGIENIAIGFSAQSKSITASNNVSIGRYAAQNLTTGNTNITIGSNAMNYNKTGANNVCIGVNAGYGVSNGNYSRCTFIGSSAGVKNGLDSDNNTYIGYNCGTQLTTGGKNTVIGADAGVGAVGCTAANNLIIGFGAGKSIDSGANGNILLGYQAGDNITSGANNVIIGYDLNADSATGSNQLNIAGVIKGDILTKVLTLQGGVNAAILPTDDPHVAGMLWVNSNVITVSAG